MTESGRDLTFFALTRGSFSKFPPKLKILDETLNCQTYFLPKYIVVADIYTVYVHHVEHIP